MTLQAVLTGDLVDSRKSTTPDAYVSKLKSLISDAFPVPLSSVDLFRGDGFQIIPQQPAQAFRCAVLLRAGLIAASPKKERWDARMAIALGRDDRAALGDVFVLSGVTLDQMTKRSPTMVFRSTDRETTEKYDLATELVSSIIDGWTAVEANTYWTYSLLEGEGHQAVADHLGKSRTTIAKALGRAQAHLIDRFLDYTACSIRELQNGRKD
jgi:hypothetical protein